MQASEGNYDMVISFQSVHEKTKALPSVEKYFRFNPLNQPQLFLLVPVPSLLDHMSMIDGEFEMGWISHLTLQRSWKGSDALTI